MRNFFNFGPFASASPPSPKIDASVLPPTASPRGAIGAVENGGGSGCGAKRQVQGWWPSGSSSGDGQWHSKESPPNSPKIRERRKSSVGIIDVSPKIDSASSDENYWLMSRKALLMQGRALRRVAQRHADAQRLFQNTKEQLAATIRAADQIESDLTHPKSTSSWLLRADSSNSLSKSHGNTTGSLSSYGTAADVDRECKEIRAELDEAETTHLRVATELLVALRNVRETAAAAATSPMVTEDRATFAALCVLPELLQSCTDELAAGGNLRGTTVFGDAWLKAEFAFLTEVAPLVARSGFAQGAAFSAADDVASIYGNNSVDCDSEEKEQLLHLADLDKRLETLGAAFLNVDDAQRCSQPAMTAVGVDGRAATTSTCAGGCSGVCVGVGGGGNPSTRSTLSPRSHNSEASAEMSSSSAASLRQRPSGNAPSSPWLFSARGGARGRSEPTVDASERSELAESLETLAQQLAHNNLELHSELYAARRGTQEAEAAVVTRTQAARLEIAEVETANKAEPEQEMARCRTEMRQLEVQAEEQHVEDLRRDLADTYEQLATQGFLKQEVEMLRCRHETLATENAHIRCGPAFNSTRGLPRGGTPPVPVSCGQDGLPAFTKRPSLQSKVQIQAADIQKLRDRLRTLQQL